VDRAAWLKWGFPNVFVPLLPFLLTLMFAWFAGDHDLAKEPILWNVELPCFTMLMFVEVHKMREELKKKKGKNDEFELYAASALIGFTALFLLNSFYYDLHVSRIPADLRHKLWYTQTMMAVLQFVAGVGMRYLQVRGQR